MGIDFSCLLFGVLTDGPGGETYFQRDDYSAEYMADEIEWWDYLPKEWIE